MSSGKWLLALFILVAHLSCGSDSTGPEALTCPSASVEWCTNAAAAAAGRDGISDALNRSTAALENPSARTALTTALSQLNTALTAGNITNARAALASARQVLASATAQLGTFPGDAADLTAVELILDQVAPLVGN